MAIIVLDEKLLKKVQDEYAQEKGYKDWEALKQHHFTSSFDDIFGDIFKKYMTSH